MTYVFKNNRTGEIINRQHDTMTSSMMKEYIRDGFTLLYIKLAKVDPLVKIK